MKFFNWSITLQVLDSIRLSRDEVVAWIENKAGNALDGKPLLIGVEAVPGGYTFTYGECEECRRNRLVEIPNPLFFVPNDLLNRKLIQQQNLERFHYGSGAES